MTARERERERERERDRERESRRDRETGGGGREGGWVVFQKKSVSRNSLRPRRGGPAESHREYYVGEGFLGSPPARKLVNSQEGRGRTNCSVPTGPDGVTRGRIA